MKSKGLKTILSILGLLTIVGVLIFAISPIIKLYITRKPIFGVDFYLSVTFVSQLLKNFQLPTNWWQYFWYTGSQGFWGYPFAHLYLMLPLAKVLGPIRGIQWYSIWGLILFLASSYLLFNELAKNKLFALFTTILLAYSPNLYGSLMGGGNLPYFNTQFLLPFNLWIIIRYHRTKNKRLLFLAGLAAGLGFFAHPGVIISFVLPLSCILLFFWKNKEEPFLFKKRLTNLFLLSFLAISAGWAYFSKEGMLFLKRLISLGGNIQAYAGPGNTRSLEDIVYLANLYLPTSINRLLLIVLFILAITWLIAALFRKQNRGSGIISTVLLLVFVFVSYFAYILNLHPFLQGWLRSFWPYILLIGALNSALFYSIKKIFPINFIFYPSGGVLRKATGFVLSLAILTLPLYYFIFSYPVIEFGEELHPNITYENKTQGALNTIHYVYDAFKSSAYPYQLGTYYLKEDFELLKKKAAPGWFDANQKNFRLYSSDAEVSLGWSGLFEMPQARGYIYPRSIPTEKRSFNAWLDIAMNENNLVNDWGINPSVAFNQTLFLIDWYSIKIIESYQYHPGAGITPEWPRSFKIPLSSYLVEKNIFEKDELFQYRPKIGIIGEKEPFNSFLEDNFPSFESRFLGNQLDNLDSATLRQTDVLVLNDFSYKDRDKANKLLSEYLSSGRGVLIEPTKVENLNDKLLETFPIKKAYTEKLSGSWNFTFKASPFLKNFGMLDYQKFSPPENKYTIGVKNENAVVSLAHQGKPLLIEKRVGPGLAVWSGLKLFQKANLDGPQEKRLLKEIFSGLTTSNHLHHYEVSSLHTSPILASTNTPAVGIFAPFEDYEVIIRDLASLNLNSQRIIPVSLGEKIDKYEEVDLKNFDALILVGYDYSNKDSAWKKLEKYVDGGGRVFIDTGRESKESEGKNLPSLLPSNSLVRKPLSDYWNIEVFKEDLFKEVEEEKFSPPEFDASPWKFSYPEGKLKEGVETIFTNHGKPVLTSSKKGKGIFIWSGLNLFYHASRDFNQEELKLISNLIDVLAPPAMSKPSSEVAWISPRHRTIKTNGAKGVLFKENHWPGWKGYAKVTGRTQKLPIFNAGPVFPGFMYMPLPQNTADVKLIYSGSLSVWITAILNTTLIILIADYVLFGKRFLWKLILFPINKLKKQAASWWDKE